MRSGLAKRSLYLNDIRHGCDIAKSTIKRRSWRSRTRTVFLLLCMAWPALIKFCLWLCPALPLTLGRLQSYSFSECDSATLCISNRERIISGSETWFDLFYVSEKVVSHMRVRFSTFLFFHYTSFVSLEVGEKNQSRTICKIAAQVCSLKIHIAD